MSDANRRTGKLAENYFERLASISEAIVNKVGDDQNGWDFVLEFPQPSGDLSPDVRSPAISCLVQIKSSASKSASYRLKLSNALKFARNPLPCFTIKVEFEKNGRDPIGFYLQHFWRDQIISTLIAVRKTHATGIDALNRKQISFKFRAGEKIEADILVARIQEIVRAQENYSAAKRKLSEETGYGAGGGKGKITFANAQALSQFVDAILDLTDEVPVKRLTFTPERFGIPERSSIDLREGTRLKISSRPLKKCAVVLISKQNSDQISLEADIYAPPLLNLPEEFRKIRIRNDIIDFTVLVNTDPNTPSTDFGASFDVNKPFAIAELAKIAKIFGWFAEDAIEIEIWIGGQRLTRGQINPDAKLPKLNWKPYSYILERLTAFLEQCPAPTDMKFTLSNFKEVNSLIEFVDAIGGATGKLKFSLDDGFNPGTEAELGFMQPAHIELGAFTIFAIIEYKFSEYHIENGAGSANLEFKRIVRRAVLRGSIDQNSEYMKAEMAQIAPI